MRETKEVRVWMFGRHRPNYASKLQRRDMINHFGVAGGDNLDDILLPDCFRQLGKNAP